MSGGTKKQYKQYPINSIQEACQVLGSLIVGVIGNLKNIKSIPKKLSNCWTVQMKKSLQRYMKI